MRRAGNGAEQLRVVTSSNSQQGPEEDICSWLLSIAPDQNASSKKATPTEGRGEEGKGSLNIFCREMLI